MAFVALTKDVDLTISNFLDGRTTYDATAPAAANDDDDAMTSAHTLYKSTVVCLSIAISHLSSFSRLLAIDIVVL